MRWEREQDNPQNGCPDTLPEIEYIWVDQICIDQESPSERNHQVQLMNSIYSEAYFVIAWLCQKSGAEEYLQYYTDRSPEDDKVFNDESQNDKCLVFNWHRSNSKKDFMRLSYWRRLWIHQEILLGATCFMLMIGRTILSASELKRRGQLDALLYPPILWDFMELNDLVIKSTDLRLLYTISMFSKMYCEDPLDKIYVLQGIVAQEERIAVDLRHVGAWSVFQSRW